MKFTRENLVDFKVVANHAVRSVASGCLPDHVYFDGKSLVATDGFVLLKIAVDAGASDVPGWLPADCVSEETISIRAGEKSVTARRLDHYATYGRPDFPPPKLTYDSDKITFDNTCPPIKLNLSTLRTFVNALAAVDGDATVEILRTKLQYASIYVHVVADDVLCASGLLAARIVSAAKNQSKGEGAGNDDSQML